ncbi:MAG: alcohol dehydrogenase catalytic domain-containing protein [Phycisphaerae bacterium]|nr:alcohol dehydrogenase catalytic domain-containing protein [Phycisphaerae bacterium]
MEKFPETYRAVQLIGPNELTLNNEKKLYPPGPYQVLAQVEAVGLCFSDLKLLKQFGGHARKTRILSGIDPAILAEIPSYVPDDKPTVPGHETVVTVVAIGEKVTDALVGNRYLIQTDYRWLPTENSNGSFGYNFEGGLQEYVLLDTRVITSPTGESFLLPATRKCSASAIALVEPWACVEEAYAIKERQTVKPNGKMLLVAEEVPVEGAVDTLQSHYGKSGSVTCAAAGELSGITDTFDDVVYIGSNPQTVEALFEKVENWGLLNIVLCGGDLGRNVTTYVGRTHYGGIRIIGTTTSDPCDSMKTIPATGEIRPGDRIDVIGAGGPMGVMHVVRNICQGVPDVTVYGGDLDDERLKLLETIVKEPLAANPSVTYHSYNPKTSGSPEAIDYVVLMAPVPQLVVNAVNTAAPNAIINIFAGIAATVTADINLQRYIENRHYFIGTSGSVLEDMLTVLEKVETGKLNTDISVAAVTGLGGAVEGIRAVENQLIPGKIIVYPSCKDLPLTTLDKLSEVRPDVAEIVGDGLWTIESENKLLGK